MEVLGGYVVRRHQCRPDGMDVLDEEVHRDYDYKNLDWINEAFTNVRLQINQTTLGLYLISISFVASNFA